MIFAILLAGSFLTSGKIPDDAVQFAHRLEKSCHKDLHNSWQLLQMGLYSKKCATSIPHSKSFFRDVFSAVILHRKGKTDDAIKKLRKYENSKKSFSFARYWLGFFYWYTGKKNEALSQFDRILDDFNRKFIGKDPWELYAAGMAAIQKKDWETSENIFEILDKKFPSFYPGLLGGAQYDHINEFHQRSARLIKKAYSINPFNPEVLVAYGNILFDNPYLGVRGKAVEYARQALKISPSRYEAEVLLAKVALFDHDLKKTRFHLALAEKITKNTPEALTLLGAVYLLEENPKAFKKLESEVVKKYPLYGAFYYVIGRTLNRHHRYKLAAGIFKSGLKIEPQSAPMLAWLGLCLLRSGDEKNGIYYIREAANIEEDYIMASNILTLYESKILPEYVSIIKGPFHYRAPKSEWPVISLLVPPVLERAWNNYVKHYGYTPPVPVRIEFFKKSDDFMVLVAGQPVESGILGVCFGQVISFLSPSSGRANWAMVISHELAHTFHVEMTRGKVPRWFTEGLAELETAWSSYKWKREMSRTIYSAMKLGLLKGVRDVDTAFSHARSQMELVTAYVHATWILRYILMTKKWKGIAFALNEYKKGKTTVQMIEKLYGKKPEEFDNDFFRYLKNALSGFEKQFDPEIARKYSFTRFQEILKGKNDEFSNGVLAMSSFLAGNPKQKKYLTALPSSSPWKLMIKAVELYRSRKFSDSERTLKTMIKLGHDGVAIRLFLATVLKIQGKKEQYMENLQVAHEFDDEDLTVLRSLATYYRSEGNVPLTLKYIAKYARLSEGDASASLKAVELAVKEKNTVYLAEFGLQLMEIAPFESKSVLVPAAEALFKLGMKKEALKPLLLFQLLEKSDPYGKIRFMTASSYAASGKRKTAISLLEKLVKVFPGKIEAVNLLKHLKRKH
ncbi:MAG: hypothetical protein JXR95_07035 [Deltaproteobacteria bacterium]|nr:hypothetical protein [Deltaproteobacteria bacterium]